MLGTSRIHIRNAATHCVLLQSCALCQDGTPLDAATARLIAAQLLSATAHAHANGVRAAGMQRYAAIYEIATVTGCTDYVGLHMSEKTRKMIRNSQVCYPEPGLRCTQVFGIADLL